MCETLQQPKKQLTESARKFNYRKRKDLKKHKNTTRVVFCPTELLPEENFLHLGRMSRRLEKSSSEPSKKPATCKTVQMSSAKQ